MGIPHELYYFGEGYPNEAYCFHQVDDGIEIYYSERGKKREYRYFSSESEACDYFYEKIVNYVQKCVKLLITL